MSFWKSGSGVEITGRTEDAFIKEFATIPNNTTALAKIVSFTNVTKDNQYTGTEDHYLLIIWKIETGDFKNREVTQKIKCFGDDPKQIDRNLNMLRLVMDLCGYKPTHGDEPTDKDLSAMHGKICGIKIREWSMEKRDGSGVIDGNFVAEVWPPAGFQTETGVKLESQPTRDTDSALTRNAKSKVGVEFDDSDIPF